MTEQQRQAYLELAAWATAHGLVNLAHVYRQRARA